MSKKEPEDYGDLLRLLSLPYEDFDALARRRLKQLLADGRKDVVVVGCFIDYFGDADILPCSRCGTPTFFRPFVAKAVREQNWKTLCYCCADSTDAFEAQLTVDLVSVAERSKKDGKKK